LFRGEFASLVSESSLVDQRSQEGCLDEAEKDKARKSCLDAIPEGISPMWVDVCAQDVCVGGEAMVNHTAMVAAQMGELVGEVGEVNAGSTCHTCKPGEACFNDVKWAMEYGAGSIAYEHNGLGKLITRTSCFEEVQAGLRAWQLNPAVRDAGMNDMGIPTPCDALPENYEMNGLSHCR